VAFFGSRKNYFFSSAVAAAGAAAGASAGAAAGAAGASAAGAAAGAGASSFLPQATKAAANNVAKRSDFFMGVFPLIKTKTFQGVPDVKMNSNM
jgi:hypothetical protein